VVSVAAGLGNTCALASNGTVTCWGSNAEGQLGDDSTTDRPFAAPVSGLTNATDLLADLGSFCAQLADGTATCWGLNQSGWDGTHTYRPLPTPLEMRPAAP
jgi:alpha-tubulin suppressor-like RCC1 family protein